MAKELNALGPGQCIPIPADLLKLSEVERLVGELQAKEKALHVLVNNAGVIWSQPIDKYSVSSATLLYSRVRGHPQQFSLFYGGYVSLDVNITTCPYFK